MSQQSTSVNGNRHKTSLNRQQQELNPTDSTPIHRQSQGADFHQSRYQYPGPRHPSSSRVQQKQPEFSYACPYKHSQSAYACPYEQPQSAYSYAYTQPESSYSYAYVQAPYPSSYAYQQPQYQSSYQQPESPSSYDAYQQPEFPSSYDASQQPEFPSSYDAYQQPQFPCSCPHSWYTDATSPPPTDYFGAPPTTFDGRSLPGQPYQGASYIPPDAEHSKQHAEMQKQAAHLREELDDLQRRFSSLKAHLDSTTDSFMGPGSTPVEQKSETGETSKSVSAATIPNVTLEPAEIQSTLMRADTEVSPLSAQFDSNMEMSLGASTEKEEMWIEI
ncbi:hypothetical protein AAC387_Pa11g0831 [Persea americana]